MLMNFKNNKAITALLSSMTTTLTLMLMHPLCRMLEVLQPVPPTALPPGRAPTLILTLALAGLVRVALPVVVMPRAHLGAEAVEALSGGESPGVPLNSVHPAVFRVLTRKKRATSAENTKMVRSS